jgi:hypothetical protein
LITVRDRLSRIPGISTDIVPGRPGPGRLGAWDVLVVLASGGGVLSVAIRMLPEIIRAARRDLTIRITTPDREVEITAANAEEAGKLLGVSDDE